MTTYIDFIGGIFPPEFEHNFAITPGSRDKELAEIKKALWETQQNTTVEDMAVDHTVFLASSPFIRMHSHSGSYCICLSDDSGYGWVW